VLDALPMRFQPRFEEELNRLAEKSRTRLGKAQLRVLQGMSSLQVRKAQPSHAEGRFPVDCLVRRHCRAVQPALTRPA
jgi:hypothetical protein